MNINDILQVTLNCGKNDLNHFFEKMDYDTFVEGYKRSVDEGEADAAAIWYNAIELALWRCFDEDAELFYIDNNYSAAGITASEEDVLNIDDFESKNDEFYRLTGFEVVY